MNATTQVGGAPSATQAVKDTASTIRTAAQVKLQYLRTLAGKIIAQSNAPMSTFIAKAKAVFNYAKNFVVSAVKTVWGWLPYAVRGAAIPAIMSTKKGYGTLTGMVKDTLGLVARLFGRGINIVHNTLHNIGYFASKPFCWVLPPVGNFLIRRNQAFTNFRQTIIDFARVAFAGTGAILTEAYTNDTTVRITTGFSSVFMPIILVNALTGGAVVAAIASLPVVGAVLATALTAKGILIALGLAATFGALVSLFRKTNREELVKSASDSMVAAMYMGVDLNDLVVNVDVSDDTETEWSELAESVRQASVIQGHPLGSVDEQGLVTLVESASTPVVKPAKPSQPVQRTQTKKRKR